MAHVRVTFLKVLQKGKRDVLKGLQKESQKTVGAVAIGSEPILTRRRHATEDGHEPLVMTHGRRGRLPAHRCITENRFPTKYSTIILWIKPLCGFLFSCSVKLGGP